MGCEGQWATAQFQPLELMKNIQPILIDAITKALLEAEDTGDLVIATSTPTSVSASIAEKVQEVFTGDIFSPEELLALSQLIYHATADKRFYDWEMPTLIGYTVEEMKELGDRLRSLTTL